MIALEDIKGIVWSDLFKLAACIVPLVLGCCIAGGMALRREMPKAARLWARLAGAALAIAAIIVLAGLVVLAAR